MNPQIKTCTCCIMDASVPNIIFDENGLCNYCGDFLDNQREIQVRNVDAERDKLLNQIRHDGRNLEYDCIVGLSGGVDSSYVLYKAVRNGLRPLAVHLDNGWNSELAVNNISNLVRSLKVDLYTHVIDWEENRDLQLSFFKANVVDIELLMDNAMLALNYKMARKYGIHHILAGTNRSTEGMRMPDGWNWLKFDKRNIQNIHRKFGSMPIRSHPLISVLGFARYEFLYRIHWTPFLDYFDFNKEIALKELSSKVGYRPYPYKHYESVFTRFYQGYILPKKFGIDKRRLHLSTLVASGQLGRKDALNLMTQSPYPDLDQMAEDREFVIKKLGFTQDSFNTYLSEPAIEHSAYGTEKPLWDFLKWLHKTVGFKRGA